MKRKTQVAFAIFASFLVLSVAPVAGASSNLAVGSSHTTDTHFNNAQELTNVTVEGTGSSADVVLDTGTNLVDSAEDGDVSEYSGHTGRISASTSQSYDGSYSLKHTTDGSGGYKVWSESGLDNYPSQGSNITLWYYATDGSDTPRFWFGVKDTDSDDWISGYQIEARDDQYNYGLSRWNDSDDSITGLDEGSADVPTNTWVKIEISWENDGTITVNFGDGSGGTLLTLQAQDTNFTSGGIAFAADNHAATSSTVYFDYVVEERLSSSGTYISQNHSVGNARKAWADLKLDNATATVTLQAWDGSSWVKVNETTFTSTGNHTLDLGTTSYEKWRTKVVYDTKSGNTVAKLHDEGVWFDDRPPDADEASASPQGGVDKNDENVTLSVPISDADFGTPQGDTVDVTFYVDGSKLTTKTISSNQTVEATATNLADGDHNWSVELQDSYGETYSSSTWNFTVNHYAANVSDLSPDGKTFNDENITVSGQVNDTDFAETSGDEVKVKLYVDGSYTGKSKNITSNQTVSFEATELGDGSHSWHFETVDEYGKTSTSSTASFEVNHYAPALDNANATPRDGEKKDTRTITLSIPVNDTDFAETSGDEVKVEFYFDGDLVASKNVTSNTTVTYDITVSTGGSHDWKVQATDEYGNSTISDSDTSTSASDPFTFKAPSQLRIYEESNPDTLVDNVTVEIRFYGGESGDSFTVQRSTSDGTVNMTGLPIDQEFIVVAKASSYYNRRIYVESLYKQSDVFLLNDSKKAVYNDFVLDDKSGNFPPGETRLIIQRGLNRSGNFTWWTISGDFFGGTNSHATYLRYNQRYRLIVENNEGDRRVIGSYMALDENNPKPITISEIIVDPPEGQSYYATSWIEDGTEDDGEKTLRFAYVDSLNITDELSLKIYEQGNESNELVNLTTTSVDSKWTYTQTLSGNQTEKTWVVEWSGKRDGQTIGQSYPIGERGGVPVAMSQDWTSRLAFIAVIVLCALSYERIATIGAMGVTGFAGVLMITGLWPIPLPLWFAAAVISVGGHAFQMTTDGSVIG